MIIKTEEVTYTVLDDDAIGMTRAVEIGWDGADPGGIHLNLACPSPERNLTLSEAKEIANILNELVARGEKACKEAYDPLDRPLEKTFEGKPFHGQ